MNTPREWTHEEVKEQFLNHTWGLIRYWRNVENPMGGGEDEVTSRLEGFAHSFLVLLDGGSSEMPAFIVAPCPHPTDREYMQEVRRNWYPENYPERVTCDISGDLHHDLFRLGAEKHK